MSLFVLPETCLASVVCFLAIDEFVLSWSVSKTYYHRTNTRHTWRLLRLNSDQQRVLLTELTDTTSIQHIIDAYGPCFDSALFAKASLPKQRLLLGILPNDWCPDGLLQFIAFQKSVAFLGKFVKQVTQQLDTRTFCEDMRRTMFSKSLLPRACKKNVELMHAACRIALETRSRWGEDTVGIVCVCDSLIPLCLCKGFVSLAKQLGYDEKYHDCMYQRFMLVTDVATTNNASLLHSAISNTRNCDLHLLVELIAKRACRNMIRAICNMPGVDLRHMYRYLCYHGHSERIAWFRANFAFRPPRISWDRYSLFVKVGTCRGFKWYVKHILTREKSHIVRTVLDRVCTKAIAMCARDNMCARDKSADAEELLWYVLSYTKPTLSQVTLSLLWYLPLSLLAHMETMFTNDWEQLTAFHSALLQHSHMINKDVALWSLQRYPLPAKAIYFGCLQTTEFSQVFVQLHALYERVLGVPQPPLKWSLTRFVDALEQGRYDVVECFTKSNCIPPAAYGDIERILATKTMVGSPEMYMCIYYLHASKHLCLSATTPSAEKTRLRLRELYPFVRSWSVLRDLRALERVLTVVPSLVAEKINTNNVG